MIIQTFALFKFLEEKVVLIRRLYFQVSHRAGIGRGSVVMFSIRDHNRLLKVFDRLPWMQFLYVLSFSRRSDNTSPQKKNKNKKQKNKKFEQHCLSFFFFWSAKTRK